MSIPYYVQETETGSAVPTDLILLFSDMIKEMLWIASEGVLDTLWNTKILETEQ